MFKSIENLTWDDIAQLVVGKSVPEQLSTGTTLAGTGLATYGLVAGDDEALVDGIVVGGIGLGARLIGVGYRIYKAFGGTPAPGDPAKQPEVTKEQAEDALGFVDAAKTDNPQRAMLMQACKDLFNMDLNAFVQLESKIRENRANKPETRIWNGAVKYCELQCAKA